MGRVSCFRLLAASGRGGGFTQPFLQILVIFVYQCTNSTDTFVRIHEGNGSSQDWTFCSLIGLAFPVQSWATKGGPPVRYRSQISEDWCGLPVLYRRSSPSLPICFLLPLQKGFIENRNLLRHQKTQHSDEKPFSCSLCKFSCKRKDKLKLHVGRMHPTSQESK